MPLPYRWLTSMMARCDGSSLLIDCGEGTQIALKEKGWSPKPIDVICFTHYHADHISGLPGLLLTMGNAERTEPLILIGPKGLKRVVEALRMIAPELPFQYSIWNYQSRESGCRLGLIRSRRFGLIMEWFAMGIRSLFREQENLMWRGQRVKTCQ